ncbi:MAG: hypothetical protein WBQ73_02740 [Candidatus Babeliales bacterium]
MTIKKLLFLTISFMAGIGHISTTSPNYTVVNFNHYNVTTEGVLLSSVIGVCQALTQLVKNRRQLIEDKVAKIVTCREVVDACIKKAKNTMPVEKVFETIDQYTLVFNQLKLKLNRWKEPCLYIVLKHKRFGYKTVIELHFTRLVEWLSTLSREEQALISHHLYYLIKHWEKTTLLRTALSSRLLYLTPLPEDLRYNKKAAYAIKMLYNSLKAYI